ncbi:F1 capsule-anchoring protein precursor [mine drainage metagenome]|uniref:F1 capsule-anchoring protein n=1 Tax=mine drainage metagenome TaxID=410659 RepID=A0A1J5QWQ8_9ZZZZ
MSAARRAAVQSMAARHIACAVLLCALAGAACAATPQELLLAVSINGQLVNHGTVVLRRDGHYLFGIDDLHAWRLRYVAHDVMNFEGRRFAELPAGALLSSRIDASTQTLQLTLHASAFVEKRIELTQHESSMTPAATGAFANYDLSLQHDTTGNSGSGLLEFGAFGRPATALTRLVVQQGDGSIRALRLDSTLQRDFVSRMRRLQVGDVLSAPGPSGAVAMLGGVRYATDFSTRPNFVTTPLFTVHGSAALPSMLQVYVDSVLALQRNVPSGPFVVNRLPLINGNGEVTTVVTDVAGHQRTIHQPYVAAPQLLRPGLRAFTVAAGLQRRDFGTRSNDYGAFAATASYRVGLDNALTAGLSGSLQRAQATAGATLDWATRRFGVVSATLAGSQAPAAGRAAWLSLGVQRTTAKLSLALHTQHTFGPYLETGAATAPPDGVDASVALGTPLGSLSVAYTGQRTADGATQIMQLADSVKLGHQVQLDFIMLHTIASAQGTSTQFGLTLTLPLGGGRGANAQWSSSSGWQTSLQQQAPDGGGWGYGLQAGEQGSASAQGRYRGPYGVYSAEVQRSGTALGERLSARGGLALLDSTLLPAPTLRGSFALIELPGLHGIGIEVNHNRVGRTDAHGKLLVSGLTAFQRNAIDIEPHGLPLDADVTNLHMTCTPPAHSGIVMRVALAVQRQATLTLMQDDGHPVPAGAVAQLRGSHREFPVGADGSAFLSGLHEHDTVLVKWPGGACETQLSMPQRGRDLLPDLGSHLCSASRVSAARPAP